MFFHEKLKLNEVSRCLKDPPKKSLLFQQVLSFKNDYNQYWICTGCLTVFFFEIHVFFMTLFFTFHLNADSPPFFLIFWFRLTFLLQGVQQNFEIEIQHFSSKFCNIFRRIFLNFTSCPPPPINIYQAIFEKKTYEL